MSSKLFQNDKQAILPFLKWAGGKRWLTNVDSGIFPSRDSYDRYIEPFLGSGAVFFHLKPAKALLSDINLDLIDTFNVVKSNPLEVENILSYHDRHHSKEYYYYIRNKIFKNSVKKAARFIYLNRTCWNGLYRVNKKGIFNVPIGTKTKVLLATDNFSLVSKFLERAKIEKMNYHEMLSYAKKNDFIFIDPPYTVKHNSNAFVKYNETLFSWQDQENLRDCIQKALKTGCKILLTNAHHDSIKELYKGLGEMICLSRSNVLASDVKKRGVYEELIIKCGY